jgi:hypothetical protein
MQSHIDSCSLVVVIIGKSFLCMILKKTEWRQQSLANSTIGQLKIFYDNTNNNSYITHTHTHTHTQDLIWQHTCILGQLLWRNKWWETQSSASQRCPPNLSFTCEFCLPVTYIIHDDGQDNCDNNQSNSCNTQLLFFLIANNIFYLWKCKNQYTKSAPIDTRRKATKPVHGTNQWSLK